MGQWLKTVQIWFCFAFNFESNECKEDSTPRNQGSLGFPCQSDNDCMFKYICIRKTCNEKLINKSRFYNYNIRTGTDYDDIGHRDGPNPLKTKHGDNSKTNQKALQIKPSQSRYHNNLPLIHLDNVPEHVMKSDKKKIQKNPELKAVQHSVHHIDDVNKIKIGETVKQFSDSPNYLSDKKHKDPMSEGKEVEDVVGRTDYVGGDRNDDDLAGGDYQITKERNDINSDDIKKTFHDLKKEGRLNDSSDNFSNSKSPKLDAENGANNNNNANKDNKAEEKDKREPNIGNKISTTNNDNNGGIKQPLNSSDKFKSRDNVAKTNTNGSKNNQGNSKVPNAGNNNKLEAYKQLKNNTLEEPYKNSNFDEDKHRNKNKIKMGKTLDEPKGETIEGQPGKNKLGSQNKINETSTEKDDGSKNNSKPENDEKNSKQENNEKNSKLENDGNTNNSKSENDKKNSKPENDGNTNNSKSENDKKNSKLENDGNNSKPENDGNTNNSKPENNKKNSKPENYGKNSKPENDGNTNNSKTENDGNNSELENNKENSKPENDGNTNNSKPVNDGNNSEPENNKENSKPENDKNNYKPENEEENSGPENDEENSEPENDEENSEPENNEQKLEPKNNGENLKTDKNEEKSQTKNPKENLELEKNPQNSAAANDDKSNNKTENTKNGGQKLPKSGRDVVSNEQVILENKNKNVSRSLDTFPGFELNEPAPEAKKKLKEPDWFFKEIQSQLGLLLGYYKVPKSCNISLFGSCDHLIIWFNTSNVNEMRFVTMARGVNSILLGFSLSKNLSGSDVITGNEDFLVEDKHMNSKNEIELDNSRNLINTFAAKGANFYIMSFTRQLLTDDFMNDIHLGTPGGIYFYFNGSSTGKISRLIIVPKKIDLSPLYVELPSNDEIFTWEPETKPMMKARQGSIHPSSDQNVSNNYEEVCNSPSNRGRMLPIPDGLYHGFISCETGGTSKRTLCPPGSIFYFVIQCCVPVVKFPCRTNCVEKILETKD